MDWLILLVPVLLGVTVYRRASQTLALVLMVFYFSLFPLLTIVADNGPYPMPGAVAPADTVNLLRGVIHLSAFAIGGIWFMSRWRTWPGVSDRALLGFSFLLVFGQLASLTMNGSFFDTAALLRSGLSVVYYINLFVIIYTALKYSDKSQLENLAAIYIAIVIGLILISTYSQFLYGGTTEWARRFGRPLHPTVLAALVYVALALAFYIRKDLILSLILFGVIILTGSRTALACIVFMLGLRYVRSAVLIVLTPIIATIGLIAIDWTHLINALAGSALFNRTDWSAGRMAGWVDAVARLPQDWLWGIGTRYYRVDPFGSSEVTPGTTRLHDGFLEGLLSFGILYTIAAVGLYAYLVWRAYFNASVRDRLSRNERECFQAIVLYACVEFTFGTLYWTDLGDSLSMVILIFSMVFLVQRSQTPEAVLSQGEVHKPVLS